MINVAQFYEELKQQGVYLFLAENEALRFKAEKDSFSSELKAKVTACKPEMIAFLKKRTALKLAREGELPALTHADKCAPIPLSYGQKQLWLLDQLKEESASYNLPVAYRIRGEIDLTALEKSVREIIRRHSVLRSTFYEVDGEIYQRVVEEFKTPFEYLDLSEGEGFSEDVLLRQEKYRCFDLQGELWCRVKLFCLAEQEYLLVVTMHHIVSDGWSISVFINELSQLYQDFSQGKSASLPELEYQYADYASWQNKVLSGESRQRVLDYWKNQLSGLAESGMLPYKEGSSSKSEYQLATVHSQLDKRLAESIRKYCLTNELTSFMFLQGVLALVLGRFSQAQDVAIGTVVAGRTSRETEALLGFFINSLVLRSRFAEEDTAASFLHANKKMILDAFSHQHLPFALLSQELEAEKKSADHPFFQVMMILQNNRIGALDFGESKFERVGANATVNNFDLELDITETDAGFYIVWSFNQNLFDADYISQLASSYRTVLEGILSAPDSRLSELPLLSADAVASLQTAEQGTALSLPDDSRLHTLFEAQASAHPTRPAVRDAHTTLSYADLSAASTRLAHALHAQGIRAGDVVCVSQARSVWSVVAVLGILKAGAIYLPLSTEAGARRGRILEDAGARLMIGEPADDHSLPCLPLRSADDLAAWPDTPVKDSSEDTAAACLLYTSGSSGHPKGVLLSHRGLANRLLWQQQHQPADASDIIAQKTSLNFVDHLAELFQPLLEGALCEVIDDRDMQDLDRFIARLADAGVTRLTLVPSLLRALLVHPGFGELTQLRSLTSSGEALDRELATAVYRALPQLTLYNYYGSTEVSADALWETVSRDPAVAVSLGQPIANMCAYVLDRHGQLQPPGVAGELHIGGPGLALGYHGDAGDNRRFCHYPWIAQGARLYHSGDLCVRDHDGRLHYRGRLDNQLKIRGMRIDAAEIEQALHRQPDIREAVVGQGEQGELVAWIVPVSADSLDRHTLDRQTRTETWHRALQTDLSRHLVPQALVLLDSLPRTRTGKLDRRALPAASEADRLQTRYVAPRTARERQLCQLWEELLERPQVGIDDNFFHLGGHSLLASRLLSRLRQSLQIDLPLKALFDHPSIAQLLTWLDSREPTQTTSLAPIPVCARDAGLRPSLAQQRLWFLDQLDGRDADYNLPMRFRLGGRLDHRAFRQSLAALIERHEVLRGNIDTVQGQARLVIRDNVSLPLREHDCSHLPADEARAAADRLLADDAAAPFDLGHDVFLRVLLIKLGEDDHLVSFTLHHIAADGWSLGILYREFNACYNALSRGEAPPLAAPRLHYADYAEWQRQWLDSGVRDQQLGYWQQQLAGLPSVHSLPLDRPRPAQARADGHSLQRRLDSRALQQIHRYCREQGVTLFMFLQTAFALLLQRYSGESDIVMGTPVAGRSHPDTESLLGFFVNNLVLRSRIDGEASFNQLLAANREMILGAFEHQHVPFETLVDALQPERSLSHSPLFQILFTLHNNAKQEVKLQGLDTAESLSMVHNLKFDIELNLAEHEDQLYVDWTFNSHLFDETTIAQLAESYDVLIKSVLEKPEACNAELAVLSESRLSQLQAEWHQHVLQLDPATRLESLVTAQALAHPQRVALRDREHCLSYAEVDTWSNRMANALVDKGIVPGDIVCVSQARNVWSVIAVLGILKAGAVYLPLTPDNSERRRQILVSANARLLVGDTDMAGGLLNLHVRGPDDLLAWADMPLAAQANPDAPACLLYTSGSSGQPKGVLLSHRGLVNRILWMQKVQPADAEDIFAQKTSLNFVDHLAEIFQPLAEGAVCEVIDDADMRDLDQFSARLLEVGVTRLTLVPSLLRAMLQHSNFARLDSLRSLTCSGEALDRGLATAVQELLPKLSLHNLYGSTEVSADVLWEKIAGATSEAIAIGRPIANMRAHVLDARGRLVPPGVIGELYLGGPGLALGYLGEHTDQQRFCTFPWIDKGARLYRSGDLCRRGHDGRLYYLGRSDTQLKIRGMRIEAGEIEQALHKLEGVSEAVVGLGPQGELVAWLVATPVVETGARAKRLMQWQNQVRNALNDHLVPQAWSVLSALPRTRTGKIDRRALPPPTAEDRVQTGYVAPRNESEAILCKALEQTLKIKRVGIHDNFFSIGCDSISAMLVVANANKAGLELKVRELFARQTVADVFSSSRELESAKFTALSMYQQTLLGEMTDFVYAYEPIVFQVGQQFDISQCETLQQVLSARYPSLLMSVSRNQNRLSQQETPEKTLAYCDRKLVSTKPDGNDLEAALEQCLESGEQAGFSVLLASQEKKYLVFFLHMVVFPETARREFSRVCFDTLQGIDASARGVESMQLAQRSSRVKSVAERVVRLQESTIQAAFNLSTAEYLTSLFLAGWEAHCKQGLQLDLVCDSGFMQSKEPKSNEQTNTAIVLRNVVLTQETLCDLNKNKKRVRKWMRDLVEQKLKSGACGRQQAVEGEYKASLELVSRTDEQPSQRKIVSDYEYFCAADLNLKVTIYKDSVRIDLCAKEKCIGDEKFSALISEYLEKVDSLGRACENVINFQAYKNQGELISEIESYDLKSVEVF